MPAKNSIKTYIEGGYYHIYNRGVDKRKIFGDEQDYNVYLSFLKNYLLPKNEGELREKLADPNLGYRERDRILKLLRLNNFSNEIILLAYCLMPNHFHLLVKQNSLKGIDKFMRSFCTRYLAYFNRKYQRVGPLFQGVYKAVIVNSDEQLLYLSGYIHRNPQDLSLQGMVSSYYNYLGMKRDQWINTETILAYFSKTNPNLSYKLFVDQREILPIRSIIIED